MEKKKRAIWPLVIILIIALAVLCGAIYYIIEDESILNVFKEEKKDISIQDFKETLENNGMVITNTTNKMGALIGAVEGYGYTVNGVDIEIYKFDEKSNEDLTKSNIKSAKEKGIITMPDFNNMTFTAMYNKGLLLLNYEQHPNKDKIVEIFNNL